MRYIHLNPVRAKMVRSPQDFAYSSHRAYLGLDEPWLVEVEPVVRHFGATKKLARQRFRLFVRAGTSLSAKTNSSAHKGAAYQVLKSSLPRRKIESARVRERRGLR